MMHTSNYDLEISLRYLCWCAHIKIGQCSKLATRLIGLVSSIASFTCHLLAANISLAVCSDILIDVNGF